MATLYTETRGGVQGAGQRGESCPACWCGTINVPLRLTRQGRTVLCCNVCRRRYELE